MYIEINVPTHSFFNRKVTLDGPRGDVNIFELTVMKIERIFRITVFVQCESSFCAFSDIGAFGGTWHEASDVPSRHQVHQEHQCSVTFVQCESSVHHTVVVGRWVRNAVCMDEFYCFCSVWIIYLCIIGDLCAFGGTRHQKVHSSHVSCSTEIVACLCHVGSPPRHHIQLYCITNRSATLLYRTDRWRAAWQCVVNAISFQKSVITHFTEAKLRRVWMRAWLRRVTSSPYRKRFSRFCSLFFPNLQLRSHMVKKHPIAPNTQNRYDRASNSTMLATVHRLKSSGGRKERELSGITVWLLDVGSFSNRIGLKFSCVENIQWGMLNRSNW